MKKLIIAAGAALLVAGCAHTNVRPDPDIGVAPAAKMPVLPSTLAQKANQLPPMTDPSLGGINKSGIDADTAYNALALRYNALVDAWGCVKQGLDARNETLTEQCLSDAAKSANK